MCCCAPITSCFPVLSFLSFHFNKLHLKHLPWQNLRCTFTRFRGHGTSSSESWQQHSLSLGNSLFPTCPCVLSSTDAFRAPSRVSGWAEHHWVRYRLRDGHTTLGPMPLGLHRGFPDEQSITGSGTGLGMDTRHWASVQMAGEGCSSFHSKNTKARSSWPPSCPYLELVSLNVKLIQWRAKPRHRVTRSWWDFWAPQSDWGRSQL